MIEDEGKRTIATYLKSISKSLESIDESLKIIAGKKVRERIEE